MVEGHGNKNEIGRAAIWNGAIEKIVHQNHLIRVRANTSVLTPQFLCLYINSEGGRKQLFKSSNTTSGLNTISTGIVKKIEMILPSLSLQQRFAAIVEKIEAQKAIATAQAEASEALFLGLLQKAFGSK